MGEVIYRDDVKNLLNKNGVVFASELDRIPAVDINAIADSRCISTVSTASLVKELKNRLGVVALDVQPYEQYTLETGACGKLVNDGPAIIFIVND